MSSKSPAGIPDDASAGSAEELYTWAAQCLRNGDSRARLVPGLIDRGLPAQMAEYFARHMVAETYSERRSRARRLTLEGVGWLAGSALTLLAIHQVTGIWSAQGPWFLGWAVVICGILRVTGGIVALPRRPAWDRQRQWQVLSRPPKAAVGSLLDLQTLGVKQDATLAAIQDSYRELARVWHPDRFPDSADMRARAEQRMKRINAAYSRLSRRALEQSA